MDKCSICGHTDPGKYGIRQSVIGHSQLHADPTDCLAARTRRMVAIFDRELSDWEQSLRLTRVREAMIREYPEAFKEAPPCR